MKSSVEIFGYTASAILRAKRASVGRVWLICRMMDVDGSGRVQYGTLSSLVTCPGMPYHCISKKRLRQILIQGDGQFWNVQRDKKGRPYRIYYFSEARVLRNIGHTAPTGYAVSFGHDEITAPIDEFRAMLYEAFHAGRTTWTERPIARETMAAMGLPSAETQRTYEKVRERTLSVAPNYVHVGHYDRDTYHRLKADHARGRADSGRHGLDRARYSPPMTFVDFDGRIGSKTGAKNAKGKAYHSVHITQQIPNSFSSRLPWASRSLTALVSELDRLTNLAPGASPSGDESGAAIEQSFDSSGKQPDTGRLYYPTAQTAVNVAEAGHSLIKENKLFEPLIYNMKGDGSAAPRSAVWSPFFLPESGETNY